MSAGRSRAGNPVQQPDVVQDLLERAGGFRRIHRSPHWMIRGYVEELYRIEPKA
jgi:hypothetical protein